MRIYMANVGTSTNYSGLFSPVFADGTFEFLPIPEGYGSMDRPSQAVRYCDLRAHNAPGQDLHRYVPADLWEAACHDDPEFATFTYGDSGGNARSVNLTRMREGDVLLFLARLESWADGKRTGEAGFYLIGGLLADYAGWVTPQSPQANRFANNAHAIRGDWEFWGIAGSSQSRRFERAVPIGRAICEKVFTDARGKPWTWKDGRSEVTTINSYTRTCRCVLDTSRPEERRRAATLRDWIEQYTGASDAELLAGVP